ncbi:hypothetical protein CHUAL_008855 [Chamberlinius hualienensis]
MNSKNTAKRSAPPGYQLVPPDGGYGWVMVACSVAIGMIMAIPILAIGLLMPEIIRINKSSTSTASWIPATAFSVGLLVAPANIIFMEKYSHRASSIIGSILASLGLSLCFFTNDISSLFVTFGILFGIGYGVTSNASSLILNQYFKRRYGQAIGYVVASHSLSRLIFAPLVELMIERYRYQGVFLILGGMISNCIVISLLFHPVTPHLKLKQINKPTENDKDKEATVALVEHQSAEIQEEPTKSSTCWNWCTNGPLKSLHFHQLKEPLFYILFFSNLTIFVVGLYITVFLPSLVMENGLTAMQAATIMSFRAGGEIVGRMCIPWIQSQFHLSVTSVYIVVCAVLAAVLTIIVFLTNFVAVIIFATCTGIAGGGIIGLNIMIIAQSVGLQRMGATLSLIMFLNGFISLGVGPFIGFLRDVVGSFSICFFVFSGVLVCNSILWLVKPFIIPSATMHELS